MAYRGASHHRDTLHSPVAKFSAVLQSDTPRMTLVQCTLAFFEGPYFFLLHLHFNLNSFLLVLAALILEPHANDSGREAGHFDELFFHERIRPRIGVVARSATAKI